MDDRTDANFDLDELLHPAQAFDHPSEVVNDPDLTLNEKRAILASWASDACAIEAAPELRMGPKTPVRFDDIMEALRALDKQANGTRYRNPRGADGLYGGRGSSACDTGERCRTSAAAVGDRGGARGGVAGRRGGDRWDGSPDVARLGDPIQRAPSTFPKEPVVHAALDAHDEGLIRLVDRPRLEVSGCSLHRRLIFLWCALLTVVGFEFGATRTHNDLLGG